MKKIFKYIVLLLLMISVSITIKPSKVNGEVKPVTEANEKLKEISEQEQETLEKLFSITQEIEEMEREEARITEEIKMIESEIEQLDLSIRREEENYNNYLDLLKQVLVSYQRGGPASYIDIILRAEDLSLLINSLNLIKDISKNTGELLNSIEESRTELERRKQNLSESIDKLNAKKEELKESMEAKQKLADKLEDFLNSLAEEKEKYEEQLNNLKLVWENLKELFKEFVDEFTEIISEGYFSLDDLNLKFNLFYIEGSINEDTFNSIINDNSKLVKMYFHFDDDIIRIEIPDFSLVLKGNFVIRNDASLEFVPESGTFYNMALEPESVEELFKNGPMIFDLKKMAGEETADKNIKIKDVHSGDGYLYFTINNFMF